MGAASLFIPAPAQQTLIVLSAIQPFFFFPPSNICLNALQSHIYDRAVVGWYVLYSTDMYVHRLGWADIEYSMYPFAWNNS